MQTGIAAGNPLWSCPVLNLASSTVTEEDAVWKLLKEADSIKKLHFFYVLWKISLLLQNSSRFGTIWHQS